MTRVSLDIEVFCGSSAGFHSTATLISGRREALLIDALFLRSDVVPIVERIRARGLQLREIIITHGHADHYFGADAIIAACTGARTRAMASTIQAIAETGARKLAQWRDVMPVEMPPRITLPDPIDEAVLEIEGAEVRVHGPRQGDSSDNAYVWLPEQRVVVAGDIVFNGAFVSVVETGAQERQRWIHTLSDIQRLEPRTVIAGHKNPFLPDTPDAIEYTRVYLERFDELIEKRPSGPEIERTMRARFHEIESLEYALKEAARAFGKEAASATPSQG